MKTQGAVVRTDRSRKRTHAYPPALPFQAHSELALLFLLGDYSCGFGTRPRSISLLLHLFIYLKSSRFLLASPKEYSAGLSIFQPCLCSHISFYSPRGAWCWGLVLHKSLLENFFRILESHSFEPGYVQKRKRKFHSCIFFFLWGFQSLLLFSTWKSFTLAKKLEAK